MHSKPEALISKEITFPEYKIRYLSNALKVIIIKDKKQPLIHMKMMINGGISQDSIPGTTQLLCGLIEKGTKNKSSEDIAESIEFYGSMLAFNPTKESIYAYGIFLDKYSEEFLSDFSDIITEPSLSENEFIKIKNNLLSGNKQENSYSNLTDSKLSKKVIYGENHPFGKIINNNTIQNIELKNIKDYYNKFFIPNNATIAFSGDIDEDNLIEILEKYLSKWKKGNPVIINIPEPNLNNDKYHFIARNNSKQATISINSLTCDYLDEDRVTLSIISQILGAPFTGTLFKELREKYNYTYNPNAYLSNYTKFNTFTASAQVNNDSLFHSIEIIDEQLNNLINDKISNENLEIAKASQIGRILMSFEERFNLLEILLFNTKVGIDNFDIKERIEKINSVSVDDIQKISKKYFDENSRYYTIIADTSLKDSIIERFNPVIYDKNYEILGKGKIQLLENGLTPNDLINNYIMAIGGKDKIDSVKTLTTISDVELNLENQIIKGEFLRKQTNNNQMYQSMKVGLIDQKIWVNEEKVFTSIRDGNITELDSNNALIYKKNSSIFSLIDNLKNYDEIISFKLNDSQYELEIRYDNINTKYIFEKSNFLIKQINTYKDGNEINILYNDYVIHEGIKFPASEKIINSNMTIYMKHKYYLNNTINKNTFNPN